MESTVNDFLNEINEIVPLKNNVLKKENIEWKECFDSKSGFTYYWNTNTNEVTWEKPKNFVINSNVNGPVPNFPELKDKVKIYRISEAQSLPKSNGNIPKVVATKVPKKKKLHNDSDDEKITLITSYGSGSSSESEDDNELKVKTSPKKSDQDEDILSTVLKRAEELKKLGNVDTKKVSEAQSGNASRPPKPISGFSLVAGYDSNSEGESEDETNQSTPAPNTQAHSTLFPIMKTPDVNDFKTEDNIPKKEIQVENSFDMKNFKRKRRLAVNFVPNRNIAKPPSPNTVPTERKGLGFKENEDTVPATTTSNNLYTNFTKGGVEFVKSETENSGQKKDGEEIDEKEMVEIYEVLHEKLAFLCEGNKDVMPVQIILIQIETLYGALKAESLKPEYLHDWLKGTSEDLIKLEKEAAPEGWSLQWDRLQKRYYYQNQESGQTQWEYPQTEFDRQEEAMDICTTPPPPEIREQAIEEREEILPTKDMPSPPPAPIISKPEPQSVPEPQIVTVTPNSQPLPPGVDYVESSSQGNSDIDSAFSTFYSELAEIENTPKPSPPSDVIEQAEASVKVEETIEPIKKKRKKMKLGQGLSLKKKDVSKLVEKWKSVQNNY